MNPSHPDKLNASGTGADSEAASASENVAIVFFDGECGLCDGFVRFLAPRDRAGHIRFSPIQGHTFQSFSADDPSLRAANTMFFKPRGTQRLHRESDAALLSISELGGVWTLARAFRVIPPAFRNGVYRFVARHRIRMFGKPKACGIPSPDLTRRLLP